jgi:Cdc6-like AAA superfamily ATPase
MSINKLKELAGKYSLSEEIVEQRENDRLSFVEKFPLAKLKDLSIDQFVQGTDDNSFCYWLEFKKIGFGIGGGNASKFGIYKTKNKEEIVYATGYGKNKTYLDDKSAKDYFADLLNKILKALDYTREDQIDKIRELEIPMWNMVLQKILGIYCPEKFLTIGSPTVLIKCAKELGIQNIEHSSDNSILINYECKKAISKNPQFSKWSYEKIGTFIWETFDGENKKRKRKESKQYWLYAPGENAYLWDEFYEGGILGLGWDEIGDLSQYKSRDEIKKALVDGYGGTGSKKNDVSANDDFLNKIKIGDVIIAKKGRGELLGYGVVTSDYIFDKNRKNYQKTRQIDWKIKGNWNVDFSLVLKTLTDITKYSSEDTEYDTYYEKLMGIMGVGHPKNSKEIPLNAKVIYAYLKNSLSHRKIQSEVLEEEAPARGGGFLAMEILHGYDIQGDKKGILKEIPFTTEYKSATGKYLEALDLLKENYPEFANRKTNINEMNLSLNTILYGPPGTGKTYKLKNEFFEKFTDESSNQTEDEYLQELVGNYSWWEVIAASLYDLKTAKVPNISEHPILKAKVAVSSNKNVRATLWGTLQAHTIQECEHVNYTNRQAPLIFNKNENSDWEVIKENLEAEAPEIIELVVNSKNYKPVTKEKKRYVFTTFHQSFSYEDFIEGIKPIIYEDEQNPERGKQIIYDIKPGLFKKIVKEANEDRDNDYAIFIDEINRGNIANIFGELITLIEDDKRIDTANYIPAKLPYSNEDFGVPPNLYIIGTMNTADRSVEALDTALRRRFSFIEMNPEPSKLSTEEFKCKGIDLEALLNAINNRIEKLLDKDYCIGHSYFMTVKNRQSPLEEIKIIFQNKILPLLQEYFYGDWGKILLVIGKEFVETKKDSIKFLSTESYEDFEEYDEKPIYNFTTPSNWTLDSFKSIYE